MKLIILFFFKMSYHCDNVLSSFCRLIGVVLNDWEGQILNNFNDQMNYFEQIRLIEDHQKNYNNYTKKTLVSQSIVCRICVE